MKEIDADEFIAESERTRKTRETLHDFRKFSDSDSYVIRDFKKLAQKGLLWQFMDSIGLKKEEHKINVYYLMYGRSELVNAPNVFICRENMQPARWYYKVGEKLPERISFTPIYTVDDFQYRKTAGLQMLENLRDEYTYSGLAERFSINYYQLKNMLSKRTNPVTGKRCYKILPQEHFVIKLRDVINPDYWFIFPEELEKHLDKS